MNRLALSKNTFYSIHFTIPYYLTVTPALLISAYIIAPEMNCLKRENIFY